MFKKIKTLLCLFLVSNAKATCLEGIWNYGKSSFAQESQLKQVEFEDLGKGLLLEICSYLDASNALKIACANRCVKLKTQYPLYREVYDYKKKQVNDPEALAQELTQYMDDMHEKYRSDIIWLTPSLRLMTGQYLESARIRHMEHLEEMRGIKSDNLDHLISRTYDLEKLSEVKYEIKPPRNTNSESKRINCKHKGILILISNICELF